MGKSIVFLIGVLISIHCHAQDSIYRLHPLLGDTIDQNEKFNYLLFKNIKETDFKYGIISHTRDTYFLKVYSPDNTVTTLEIDSTELKQYVAKLDMVQKYYANEGKKDTAHINLNPDKPSDNQFKELNKSLMNEKSRDKIMKEVRTANRINEDAERYKNRNDHSDLFSGSGHVEFPVIKTKKRKKK